MTPQSVTLPPLAGSRPAAAVLLSSLPADLTGQQVTVLSRDLLSGSPSFADELVRELTVERNAASVVVVGAEPTFEQYVHEAARNHDVGTRVSTRDARDRARHPVAGDAAHRVR
ncbi:MAG TPA: hypothetical protein VGD72_13605 [Mycobacteriales bacterium]